MRFIHLIALVPFVALAVLAELPPPPPPLDHIGGSGNVGGGNHYQKQHQQQQYQQPPVQQQQYQQQAPPPPVSYQQQYTQAPSYNNQNAQQQQQQYQAPPPVQQQYQQAPPPPAQQQQHYQQQPPTINDPYYKKQHYYGGGGNGDIDHVTSATKRRNTPYKGGAGAAGGGVYNNGNSRSPSLPLSLRPLNLPEVNPLDQLHFRLQQGKQVCLTEELSKATVLLVKYSASAWNIDSLSQTNSNFDIQVIIKDPMGNVVSRQQSRPTDKLFLTAATDGVHQICFQTSGIYNSKVLVKLGVEVFIGGAGDPHIISPVEAQLHDLASVIRTAVGQVSLLQNEQNLQKTREDSYKALSTSIDSMIVKWGLIQGVMAILSSYYQVFHMRGFFRYKKLV